MRRWLASMCHPDGQIAFFNEAAVGVAAQPNEIEAYAARCGLAPVPAPPSPCCVRGGFSEHADDAADPAHDLYPLPAAGKQVAIGASQSPARLAQA
jgi:hypothetical protein